MSIDKDCPRNRYCFRDEGHEGECIDGRNVFVKRTEPMPEPSFDPITVAVSRGPYCGFCGRAAQFGHRGECRGSAA